MTPSGTSDMPPVVSKRDENGYFWVKRTVVSSVASTVSIAAQELLKVEVWSALIRSYVYATSWATTVRALIGAMSCHLTPSRRVTTKFRSSTSSIESAR